MADIRIKPLTGGGANFFDQFDNVQPVSGGSQASNAVSSIESGGNYHAVGPETGRGRALGRYQVMTTNIGPWSKEVLGREVTPGEFISSPHIQDAIFNAKFGEYTQKYGPEGAARAWFAGEGGMNDPNRRDVLGTSVADYSRKFTKALGYAPEQATELSAKAAPTGNFFDQFDEQTKPAATFSDRFEGEGAPTGSPELKSALLRQAQDRTTGIPLSPAQNLDIDFQNQLSAASQGTTPNVSAHAGNLISDRTTADELGNILYQDPQTGQFTQTDKTKQVAIRDPADGRVKVYQRTDATDEGPVTGLSRVAMTGMAAGAPTARAMLPAASKAITPTASDIFSTAKPAYRAFSREASKIDVPAETATGIADRVRGALERANFIEELAPQVYRSVAILDRGKPLTLDALQNIKRVVGRSFNSADKNSRDAAAVASAEISKVLAEISPEAAANLKKADGIHSTARAVQELQRKRVLADLRTGRAGYGGNGTNTIRQVLAPFVQRAIEGKSTPFKPDEIKAMLEIVEGNSTVDTLRTIGQLSPTKGSIATIGGMATGGFGGAAALGPIGVAGAAVAPILGAASNKLAAVLTGKQLERLQSLVAKRSPAYAAAVRKATERYEKAQLGLINRPSPSRFAGYLAASRTLASGLQRDGIQVTSGELLRAVAGQQPTTAEEQ